MRKTIIHIIAPHLYPTFVFNIIAVIFITCPSERNVTDESRAACARWCASWCYEWCWPPLHNAETFVEFVIFFCFGGIRRQVRLAFVKWLLHGMGFSWVCMFPQFFFRFAQVKEETNNGFSLRVQSSNGVSIKCFFTRWTFIVVKFFSFKSEGGKKNNITTTPCCRTCNFW